MNPTRGTGAEILRKLVSDRLDEFHRAETSDAGASAYLYCLGASDALLAASLLTPDDKRFIMADLALELERRGVGKRLAVRDDSIKSPTSAEET